MSLNRIGSIETLTDHSVRRGSDTSHRPRRLSFSPIPQQWDPPQPSPNKTSDHHDHFYQQQQERGSPSPSHTSRRLSLASASALAPADEEPVSAFEVPRWKRLGQFSSILASVPSCSADSTTSANRRRRVILFVRCRYRFWLCRAEARLDRRRRLPR